MVPFAGYEMPVQYDSVIAEAKAVRSCTGMFDVSHMARLTLIGERVVPYLEWVTSNDVSKVSDATGQYSLLPNETGGVVDDIIVYRIDGQRFSMVVNAANHTKDVEWLHSQNSFEVDITDQTSQTAMIAVQGPTASDLLAQHSDAEEAMRNAPAFGVVRCLIDEVDCVAARSGYTGEDGFELVCRADDALRLWDALLGIGVKPCGLASRDVLRVEAGLPLYGHELSDERSPIEAGLGWVISKSKEFIGFAHINRIREAGAQRKLLGIKLDSKRLLAPEMDVYVADKHVGEVSSGVFSPMLDSSIAFAFLEPDIEIGATCEVDVRGKRETGTVLNKRFFKRSK